MLLDYADLAVLNLSRRFSGMIASVAAGSRFIEAMSVPGVRGISSDKSRKLAFGRFHGNIRRGGPYLQKINCTNRSRLYPHVDQSCLPGV